MTRPTKFEIAFMNPKYTHIPAGWEIIDIADKARPNTPFASNPEKYEEMRKRRDLAADAMLRQI